jgi:hypothetical protein
MESELFAALIRLVGALPDVIRTELLMSMPPLTGVTRPVLSIVMVRPPTWLVMVLLPLV